MHRRLQSCRCCVLPELDCRVSTCPLNCAFALFLFPRIENVRENLFATNVQNTRVFPFVEEAQVTVRVRVCMCSCAAGEVHPNPFLSFNYPQGAIIVLTPTSQPLCLQLFNSTGNGNGRHILCQVKTSLELYCYLLC